MRDQRTVALFDGSPEVEVVTQGRVIPVMAIAHELGYVLTAHRIRPQTGISAFTFVRDDGESARRRAAWTRYHYGINGAWWATATPGPSPHAISPMRAAEARFGLYLYQQRPIGRYLRAAGALVAVAAAAGVWFLLTAWPGAVVCLGIALLGGATMLWGPRWRARREAEFRRTLEEFERQRVFWSYDGREGGGGFG
ncbi:hypothetical protein [Streptomyces sedi]|uniref:Uncharacterized protein n=1 Tax=Streptomyces sedi TaxID=555059 RepID=A0A5C4VG37_9ACTN|nr:hypothetical protein [Streptomyces sedi]TNM34396.1 hypothetical protein FH715_01570 [Streptomyces sedi]